MTSQHMLSFFSLYMVCREMEIQMQCSWVIPFKHIAWKSLRLTYVPGKIMHSGWIIKKNPTCLHNGSSWKYTLGWEGRLVYIVHCLFFQNLEQVQKLSPVKFLGFWALSKGRKQIIKSKQHTYLWEAQWKSFQFSLILLKLDLYSACRGIVLQCILIV